MYYELTDYYCPEDYEDFDDSNIRTDNIFELDDEMMLDDVTNDSDCIQFTKYTMDVLEKFLLDSDDMDTKNQKLLKRKSQLMKSVHDENTLNREFTPLKSIPDHHPEITADA